MPTRDGLARGPPHRLSRLLRSRADGDRRADSRPARLRAHRRGPEGLQRSAEVRSTQPRFANARNIGNTIDRAWQQGLSETVTTPTGEQLTNIEVQGILRSSFFEGRSRPPN